MFKSKFSLAYFLILAGICLITSLTQAQTKSGELSFETGKNAKMVTYEADVDSNEVVYSDWFSVAEYIPFSLYTYPVSYTKIQSSTLAKPHITVTVERSNDQTNVIVTDTIGTVGDSLETLYSGTANLNNGKSWYYRVKYTGTIANRSDATLRTDLVFLKPED